MKKVILRGPSLTQSGYGVHTRQVASWLRKKSDVSLKFQALPWGDTPWILDHNWSNGLIGEIIENTSDPSVDGPVEFDVSFQVQLPNEWDPRIAKFNVGITAGVETDICNPEWSKCCNLMNLLIVPSNHVKNTLLSSGNITTPIKVIPESFCDEILQDNLDKVTENLPLFSTNFNFLIFGQITGDNPYNDRKNIFFTIKWICEAFKDNKDVGIVIKTNMGRNTPIDKKRSYQLMQSVLKECRKGEFPKIHLLHGDMSDEEVSALYRHPQIKSLVTLTRGEGYGLPILEAAASDLPVIATNWSGHTDFLNHGKFIEISYNLKQIHPTRADGKIFIPSSKWAEPIEEDFKKKITKFKSSSTIPKEWATNLGIIIREKYSHSSISNLYDEAMKDIL